MDDVVDRFWDSFFIGISPGSFSHTLFCQNLETVGFFVKRTKVCLLSF